MSEPEGGQKNFNTQSPEDNPTVQMNPVTDLEVNTASEPKSGETPTSPMHPTERVAMPDEAETRITGFGSSPEVTAYLAAHNIQADSSEGKMFVQLVLKQQAERGIVTQQDYKEIANQIYLKK